MIINPLLLESQVVKQILEDRALLAVKAGGSAKAMLSTDGRSLGLAHEIFTLELSALTTSGQPPQPAGVRVLELKGETPVAFYDIADPRSGEVSQMSATSPYPQLFARALEMLADADGGEQRFDLRLLRVPALNFEALWLHADEGDDDKLIPLRGFHGFTPMQPVSFRDALERLREPAHQAARQDDTMGG